MLSIDTNIYATKNIVNHYKNRQVYTLHYPKGIEVRYSSDTIRNVYETEDKFYHFCSTDSGSSGAPLIDTETENVYTVKTDEDGVALFEGVRAGRYIRKVTGLDEQYVLPADRELYAEEDEEIKETVEVKFVVGNIVVYKTDDETGKPVAGCTFQVLDYETGEVIEEKVTDENGYARFEEYRYGKYLVQESEAAKDYEKSEDVMEVSIVEDGVDVVVSFTNVYTADIAVALYAVIALVSVYAIVKATKRMKRN